MSPEYKLLAAIYYERNFPLLYAVNLTYIKTQEVKDCLIYLQNYAKKYKDFPAPDSLSDEFKRLRLEKQDKDSHYLYEKLVEEIGKEVIHNHLVPIVQQFVKNDKKPKEVVDELMKLTSKVPLLDTDQQVFELQDVVDGVMEDIEKRIDEFSVLKKKIGTGIKELDDLGGGLRPGSLITIQGRLGVGKSWFMLYIAAHMWEYHVDQKPLIVSLEMPFEEVTERLISILTHFSYSQITTGLITPEELKELKNRVRNNIRNSKNRLVIACPSKIDLSGTRSLITQHHATAAFIDNFQLVVYEGNIRDGRMQRDEIAYGFKRISKEFKVPVIVLAQTNREGQRAGVPDTSHIKDSDAVGAASDIVYTIYTNDDLEMLKRIGIDVGKYRRGKRGRITCDWDFDLMRIGTNVEVIDRRTSQKETKRRSGDTSVVPMEIVPDEPLPEKPKESKPENRYVLSAAEPIPVTESELPL